jgi:hypothetical protein
VVPAQAPIASASTAIAMRLRVRVIIPKVSWESRRFATWAAMKMAAK